MNEKTKDSKEYVSKRIKFRISTRVIIFNKKQEILILKCANPKKREGWDFPGGHVDKNEQIAEAALREVQEETNLSITQLNLLDTNIEEKSSKCIIYYFTQSSTQEIKLSEEHKDFKWVSINELAQYDLFYKLSKPLAKKAFKLQQK